jgi:hypothetical protein
LIADHLDPEVENCYKLEGIARSLCNVVLTPGGTVKIYLFGQLMPVLGGKNDGQIAT